MVNERMIIMAYFDFAANPPVDQRVLDTYYKTTQEFYANPNSFHALGLASKHKLDEASAHIAKLMGCDQDDIIYTSGATEANNLAIKGVCERYKNRGKHILISSLEFVTSFINCAISFAVILSFVE